MKIRKVFESVEFYEKIRTWHEGRQDLKVIDNIERMDIVSLFPDLRKAEKSRSKMIFRSGINRVDVDVLVNNDEWYFVRLIHNNKHEYFKCDQKEGLIECIKKELLTNKIYTSI